MNFDLDSIQIQNSPFKIVLYLPADESPARRDVVGHVEGLLRLDIADAADYDHPVEKLRVAGFADILDRIIRQRPSFAFAQNLQQLVIEHGIDLADARRAGK